MTAYECACGDTHYSNAALMYCEVAMQTEDRQARKPAKVKKPPVIVRGID